MYVRTDFAGRGEFDVYEIKDFFDEMLCSGGTLRPTVKLLALLAEVPRAKRVSPRQSRVGGRNLHRGVTCRTGAKIMPTPG